MSFVNFFCSFTLGTVIIIHSNYPIVCCPLLQGHWISVKTCPVYSFNSLILLLLPPTPLFSLVLFGRQFPHFCHMSQKSSGLRGGSRLRTASLLSSGGEAALGNSDCNADSELFKQLHLELALLLACPLVLRDSKTSENAKALRQVSTFLAQIEAASNQ